jgi:hypothetical protein
MIRLFETGENKPAFVTPALSLKTLQTAARRRPATNDVRCDRVFRVTVRGDFVIDLQSSCRSEKAADRNGQPWQPLQSTTARDRRGSNE